MRSRRDAGLTALFLGFFAAAWFGWAEAGAALRAVLVAASVASLAVAAGGAVVGFRAPAAESALHDRAAYRRYGIIVGIEFATAFAGAGGLGATGAVEYIPVWVCGVVGVHFFPLAPVLRDPGLRPLGAVLAAVAVAGLVTALASGVDASTVVGIGAGAALLGYASLSLARTRRA